MGKDSNNLHCEGGDNMCVCIYVNQNKDGDMQRGGDIVVWRRRRLKATRAIVSEFAYLKQENLLTLRDVPRDRTALDSEYVQEGVVRKRRAHVRLQEKNEMNRLRIFSMHTTCASYQCLFHSEHLVGCRKGHTDTGHLVR